MADATPHIHVEFHTLPVQDNNATRKQGRPIFTEVEHCRIRWTGDNKRELDEPADQKFKRDPQTNEWVSYREAFPEHYKLFQLKQDQSAVNGTPLSEVPFLTEAKRAELRALNVLSLEGLASMDGTLLQRLGMGGRELKNKAQAFIDAAAGSAAETRMAEELSARDAEIEALKGQMAELLERMTSAPVSRETEPEPDPNHVSPFQGFDDGALRAFIEDRSGKKPHHLTGRTKLMLMAEEILAAEQPETEQAA